MYVTKKSPTKLSVKYTSWAPTSVINGGTWGPFFSGRKSLGLPGVKFHPEIGGVISPTTPRVKVDGTVTMYWFI